MTRRTRWWSGLAFCGLVAATMTVAPRSAAAQTLPTGEEVASGVYVSGAGALTSRKYAEDFIGRATFDPGTHWNGAVGYRFPFGLRTEVEFGYLRNNFNELVFFSDEGNSPPEPGDGNVDARVWMINGYYDIPLEGSRFQPYIGGGGGRMKARINSLSSPTFRAIPITVESETPWLNAFNVRAGLGVGLTPQAALLVGYRFFRSEQLYYPIEAAGIVLEPNGVQTHSFEFGMRYTFGR